MWDDFTLDKLCLMSYSKSVLYVPVCLINGCILLYLIKYRSHTTEPASTALVNTGVSVIFCHLSSFSFKCSPFLICMPDPSLTIFWRCIQTPSILCVQQLHRSLVSPMTLSSKEGDDGNTFQFTRILSSEAQNLLFTRAPHSSTESKAAVCVCTCIYIYI